MRITIKDSFSTVKNVDGKPKKIANNTFRYRTTDGADVIRLHVTDIAVMTPEGLKLDSGNWRSVTTKDRLKTALALFGYGRHYIRQVAGEWHVCTRPEHKLGTLFRDGMFLPASERSVNE